MLEFAARAADGGAAALGPGVVHPSYPVELTVAVDITSHVRQVIAKR